MIHKNETYFYLENNGRHQVAAFLLVESQHSESPDAASNNIEGEDAENETDAGKHICCRLNDSFTNCFHKRKANLHLDTAAEAKIFCLPAKLFNLLLYGEDGNNLDGRLFQGNAHGRMRMRAFFELRR